MRDYYSLVSRAVAGLEENTGEARHQLYEHARKALVEQLQDMDPPGSDDEITREGSDLNEAIKTIESDVRKRELELLSGEPISQLLHLLNDNERSPSLEGEEFVTYLPEGGDYEDTPRKTEKQFND